ncbi:MAG: hypothetical protein RIC30_01465 [Marinoscillum sp.]|uniref:hypothetical protein n=1 Tax=Marinoscillum sp. TaxID=2024838 RepID=UPI0032FC0D6F
MKKYGIHIVYILIIVALAVLSRVKTNSLEAELLSARDSAEQNAVLAREASEQALKQAELARMEASRAKETEEQTRKMLEECQQRK